MSPWMNPVDSPRFEPAGAAERADEQEQPLGRIVFVGEESRPAIAALAERLRDAGFEIAEATPVKELPQALASTGHTVVIAPAAANDYATAHRAVAAAQAARRPQPVVVLCDECDFGEYYSLMNEGALEFYELSETLDEIVRGVCWAAYARAG